MRNPESQWFGEKSVSPEEKTHKVIGVFDRVAQRYDLMNDVMSGGLHRLWKDEFVRLIRPRGARLGVPLHYLDVAGGTGDIAFRLRQKTAGHARITVCDLNPNMLGVGRNRAIDKGWARDFSWVTGNAERLPLPENTVDVYTIAFGLRNVTHIDTALAEAYRVLKPGGRFFCLEFSRVEGDILAKLYRAYSDNFIPYFGQKITQDRESYQYLVESIRKFPSQEKLQKRLGAASFKSLKYINFSAGVVAVHQGVKA